MPKRRSKRKQAESGPGSTSASVPSDRPTVAPRRNSAAVETLRAAENVRVGTVVEIGLPLAVALVGGLSGFGLLVGAKWGAAWLALFAGDWLYTRLRRGAAMAAFVNSVERVNGSIAGGIDTIARQLRGTHDRCLGEAESHTICKGLLARIKEYALIACGIGNDERVRVTLAVPVASSDGRVAWVRIWCYDQDYEDRRWSEFEVSTPGAGRAWLTGLPQVIGDVNAVARSLGLNEPSRRYASVAAIPVIAGGPRGDRLAVVNIDVRTPGFFTQEKIEHRILPLVAPVVNLIGLVLMMRRAGTSYTFGQ